MTTRKTSANAAVRGILPTRRSRRQRAMVRLGGDRADLQDGGRQGATSLHYRTLARIGCGTRALELRWRRGPVPPGLRGAEDSLCTSSTRPAVHTSVVDPSAQITRLPIVLRGNPSGSCRRRIPRGQDDHGGLLINDLIVRGDLVRA